MPYQAPDGPAIWRMIDLEPGLVTSALSDAQARWAVSTYAEFNAKILEQRRVEERRSVLAMSARLNWELENRQVEIAKPRWVGDDVDLLDPAVCDHEGEYAKQPPLRSPHDTDRSIDERRSYETSHPREVDRSLRPGPRPADLTLRVRRGSLCIETHYDIRIEHCEQSFEIARAQHGEKRIDDSSLTLDIRVADRPRPLNPPARATRELPRRRRRAFHDTTDLVVRYRKHVV